MSGRFIVDNSNPNSNANMDPRYNHNNNNIPLQQQQQHQHQQHQQQQQQYYQNWNPSSARDEQLQSQQQQQQSQQHHHQHQHQHMSSSATASQIASSSAAGSVATSTEAIRRISPIPSNYIQTMSNYYASMIPPDEESRYPSESQSSRHARRLYVGGIPPGHTSEEQLKLYLNEVISKCLGEENLNSYILSIYMNHKKCFAFIELSSIELATACLELDGIVYLSSVLKIQRANEYKPELVANLPRATLRFNPSKAPFPHNTSAIESHNMMLSSHSSHCIRMCSVVDVTPGAVVLIGFPHDEGAKRSGITAGSAAGPAAIRFYLRKLLASAINPEFGIDISRLQILDVGDVPLGLTLEDALSRLDDSVIDVIQRGAIPIILGGSGDLAYACASGLMTASAAPIAVIDINSSLNMEPLRIEQKVEVASTNRLLLNDARFCPPRDTTGTPTGFYEPHCDGRFVIYGAQGTLCAPDAVNFIQHRGGHVVWLTKDIRSHDLSRLSRSLSHYSSSSSVVSDDQDNTQLAVQQFLNSFGDEVDHHERDEIMGVPLSSAALTGLGFPPNLPQLQRPPSDSSSIPSSAASYTSAHYGLPPITSVPLPFSKLLRHLSRPSLSRPIMVSFSLQAMSNATCPGVYIRSSNGLTVEEALEICSASGSDPNVTLFTVNELNPMIEEPRSASLAAELIYWFLLGYTNRRPKAFLPSQNPNGQPVYRNRSSAPTSTRSPIPSTIPTTTRSPTASSVPIGRSPIREFDLSQQDMLLAASLLNLSDGQDL